MQRQTPSTRTRILRWIALLVCIIGLAGVLAALFDHFGPQFKRSPRGKAQQTAKPKPPVPKNLVSLGDSITFGEHLPGSKLATKPGQMGTPAPSSYPLLIGKSKHWHVIDLGVPSLTSAGLLDDLKQPTFQTALKDADIVTLDIGSNDLIQAANNIFAEILQNPAAVTSESESASFQMALNGFSHNLPKIIAAIRTETKAPIVLMTLYDPFPDNTALHEITEPLLAKANDTILQEAVTAHCTVANTYAVMNHRQNTYIRVSDVHPSISGQQHIAQVVDAAISNPAAFQPKDEAIVQKGTRIRSKPYAFAHTLSQTKSGQMYEIIGKVHTWLHVRVSAKITGYVPASSAEIVLRPWPISANTSYSAHVLVGTLAGPSNSALVSAILWQRTVYSPADQLAKLAGANRMSWNAATRTLDLTTPNESGLTKNAATYPLGFMAATKLNRMNVDFQTKGILLTIDGEPVHLPHPILTAGNTIYLPALDVWQALGGRTIGS